MFIRRSVFAVALVASLAVLVITAAPAAAQFAASTRVTPWDTRSRLDGGPVSVAVGDLTGDGRADLVVVHPTLGITIVPGAPGGTFGTPVPVLRSSEFVAAAVADVDGFGVQTLLAVGPTGGVQFVPQGDGTFYQWDFEGGQAITTGDVDGDGRHDVVVASGGATPRVEVLYGGSGRLGDVSARVSLPAAATALALADVDGDDLPEIVAATARGLVMVYHDGRTLFGDTAVNRDTGFTGVAAADFDHDGLMDLVATDGSQGTGVLYFVRSMGAPDPGQPVRFAPPASVPLTTPLRTGVFPRAIAVFDANHDDYPDVAVTITGAETAPAAGVQLLTGGLVDIGHGQQAFALTPSAIVGSGQMPVSLTFADVNGDTLEDLVVANLNPTVDLRDGIEDVSVALRVPSAADFTNVLARIDVLTSEAADLRAQVASLNAQLNDLFSANATCTAARSQLQSQLDACVAGASGKDAQIASLQAQLATATGELATLNGQVTTLTAQVASLMAERDAAAATVAQQAQTIADLRAQGEALTAEVDRLTATVADQQARLAALTRDNQALSSANQALSQENARLTGESATLASANAVLSGQVATLGAENAALTQQNAALTQENAALAADLAAARAGLAAGLAAIQHDFRVTFRNPAFVIPGTTPEQQWQNLVQALVSLERGRQEGLYKALLPRGGRDHDDRGHDRDDRDRDGRGPDGGHDRREP